MFKILCTKLALIVLLTVFIGCKQKNQETPITKQPEKKVKIKPGLIYIDYIGDSGWTFAHEQGRKALASLPYVETPVFMESVPEDADAVRAMTRLVEKGHNVIFATSYGYTDAIVEVAEKNPEVIFMHCSGFKTSPNLGVYFGKIEEPRYLSGIVAGKMTKTNIIGYVAAHPIPEVIRGINAFTLGVQSVNKNAVVKVLWTNTWYDPEKEKKSAYELISIKADVLTMHQDTPAVIQAAERSKVYSIGYNSDMSKYAPNYYLTAPIWHWEDYYINVAEKIHNGTWVASDDIWGMKEGMVGLAPFGKKVPEDLRNLVSQKKQEIIEGKLRIFEGPIVDQKGTIMIPEGRDATLQEELSMDYFIKGVKVIGK